jgi:hypothetical protein
MVSTQTLQKNPFPGLRPFEAHENDVFFGREGQTDELLRRLCRHRFLAVVGTSGSGKSSLVRAGLLPALFSGFMTKAGSSWRVAVMRPGNDPIANLAQALNHPDVFGLDTEINTEDALIKTIITETVLRRGALGLVEVVQQARRPSYENLLIVVDQFEELFRFKQNSPRKILEMKPPHLSSYFWKQPSSRSCHLCCADNAFRLSRGLRPIPGFAGSDE